MRLRVVALCVALCTVAGAAQERIRVRVGSKIVQIENPLNPRVTITSPTLQPSITVTSATLSLQGLAETTSETPITGIGWVNDRGGSGSAVLAVDGTWETSAAAGSEVVVHDTFTGSSTTELELLVASPTGGQWDETENTLTTAYQIERRSGGYVRMNSAGANGRIAYAATPAQALAGTNYDVSLEITAVGSADGDDGVAIRFGVADISNYCVVQWYGPAAATDLHLVKVVAGTPTSLGTANIDPAVGNVISVEVRGTSLSVKEDGVERIAATDAFCDDATGVGFGIGGFRGVAADDASSQWNLDNFTVTDQDGTSDAITLQSGVNVITVTATDANLLTGTDTITVTLAVSDTTAPVVTITSPTVDTTYVVPPAIPDLTISGTTSDNLATTSVTWACANCTPTSGTATLTNGTDWTFDVTAGEGSNSIVVTAHDAATNTGTDTLTATLNSSDVTVPTITITTDGGSGAGANFTTASSSVTIGGTASDNVGVASVTGSCSSCTVGSVTGTTAWSAPVTLAAGTNVVMFTAHDAAGNMATDSITVTRTVTLNISTTNLPAADQSAAYSQTLNAVGGTTPYTWTNNGAGTSLNDGDAQCAGLVISSAGVVSGTPTQIGLCSWTAKVTDNVAATDTQALTIDVRDPAGEGSHDYYDNLIARGDCFKAYSLRPLAGQTTAIGAVRGVADCTHGRYVNQLSQAVQVSPNVSYDFSGDTDPEKQDAAKSRVPAWLNFSLTLQDAVDASTSTITIVGTAGFENGRSYKIDNEVVTQISRVGQVLTVSRGQLGTTAASHNAGASVLYGNNSLSSSRFNILTDGDVSARYLFTWDYYPTGSYVGTGLANHKAFQIASTKGGQQYVEMQTNYAGPPSCCPQPSFTQNVDVAALTTRYYAQSLTPGFVDNPGQPMETSPFVIQPSKFTRFWVEIEANAESDTTKYVDSGQDLAAAVTDTTTTQVVITHNGLGGTGQNPFTANPHVFPQGALPGRALKVDSEIMTIVTGTTSGATRTLTVVRGAYATTPATHSAGAAVSVIEDYVSVWIADEDTNPVQLYDRISAFIPLNSTTSAARGGLQEFWIEFNTSTQQMPAGRADGRDGNIATTGDNFEDLVAYVRNLVVLKNPPADWSALRVKPVR